MLSHHVYEAITIMTDFIDKNTYISQKKYLKM